MVDKYDVNRYVKHFTCWNQLLAMMFGQLSNRESLRDLIVAFEAHRAKQYHLGLGHKTIAKTTFASANQNRGYNAFKELSKIHQHESFFVVRAKKNLQYKCCKWRRRLPKNILTDAEIEFTEYNSYRKYPEKTLFI